MSRLTPRGLLVSFLAGLAGGLIVILLSRLAGQ